MIAGGSLLRGMLLFGWAVLSVVSRGYDEDFARRMVTYASIAMMEPDEVEAWVFPNDGCSERTRGDKVFGTYRAKDTAFGYIVVNEEQRYILASFKASNDTQDWIDHDLRSTPLAYRRPCTIDNTTLPGHVHHGFCTYYSELDRLGMGQDLALLHRLHRYPIHLTGWSLGAAAAVVCGSHLAHRYGILVDRVYTFGEPRVGDPAFADSLTTTQDYYRVVHHRDVVPHLTECCLPDCQRGSHCPFHQGSEVWYNNDMRVGDDYRLCMQGESWSCSNSQADLSVDDHYHYFDMEIGQLCRTPSTNSTTPPLLEPPWDDGSSSAALA